MSSVLFCGRNCVVAKFVVRFCWYVHLCKLYNRPTVHFVRDAFAWSCWLFYVYLYIIYSTTLCSQNIDWYFCQRAANGWKHTQTITSMRLRCDSYEQCVYSCGCASVHTRVLFTYTSWSVRWIKFRIYDKFLQMTRKATRKIYIKILCEKYYPCFAYEHTSNSRNFRHRNDDSLKPWLLKI